MYLIVNYTVIQELKTIKLNQENIHLYQNNLAIVYVLFHISI